MKAMILAAGRGERMRPLSDKTPKPLLLLKGKPLIEHHVTALAKSGIKEIVINLNHLGEQIQSYLKDGKQFGVKIHYSFENPLLNTGGGIIKALKYLGSDPFLLVSADIYASFPFANILNKKIDGLAHIILVKNPDFHPLGDFSLQGNIVTTKTNKTFTYGNIGIYKPELFHNFINDEKRMVFPLSSVVKPAVLQGLVTGELFLGKWFNVGTPKQLKDLQEQA